MNAKQWAALMNLSAEGLRKQAGELDVLAAELGGDSPMACEQMSDDNDVEDGGPCNVVQEPSPCSVAHTRLTEKQHSPLVIRKITTHGFPIFVGIIADENLDKLDDCIHDYVQHHMAFWKSDGIQDKRRLAGGLSDFLAEQFSRQEGVAVTLWIDKMCVSSLRGDFMNHHQCRLEYYSLLQMSTNI